MVRPFFDTNNLHSILFYVAFAIWVVPELISSFSQHINGDGTVKDRGSYLVVAATLYSGCFVAFLLSFRLSSANIH